MGRDDVVAVALSGFFFFFHTTHGIRDLVRSRGLDNVYTRQLRCLGKVVLSLCQDCHPRV